MLPWVTRATIRIRLRFPASHPDGGAVRVVVRSIYGPLTASV
jgi:hypothetical protein